MQEGLFGAVPEKRQQHCWGQTQEGPWSSPGRVFLMYEGRFEPGQMQRRLCLVLLRCVCGSDAEVISGLPLHLQHIAVMQKQIKL